MGRFLHFIIFVLVLGVVASGCGRKDDLELPPNDDEERGQNLSQ